MYDSPYDGLVTNHDTGAMVELITSFHGFPIPGEQLQTANHVLHVIWIPELPQYS